LGPLLSSFQSSLQAGSPIAYALAFLGGLLVSFTPCVYPILPVTVGYIGSRSGGSRRHAFLLSAAYAAGMALTYAALGMAAGLSGSMFGEATAHPLAYLVLGNVCILLSLSLFDVFHLPTPAILTRAEAPGSASRGMGGAFAGKEVPAAACKSDAVDETIRLAGRLKIEGTPTMILPDGRLISGYMEADALLALIK